MALLLIPLQSNATAKVFAQSGLWEAFASETMCGMITHGENKAFIVYYVEGTDKLILHFTKKDWPAMVNKDSTKVIMMWDVTEPSVFNAEVNNINGATVVIEYALRGNAITNFANAFVNGYYALLTFEDNDQWIVDLKGSSKVMDGFKKCIDRFIK